MSVVVAIKENGIIYLGCDSQVTQGGTRSTLKNPNNYKIWKVNNVDNCLMAHVGALRDACVIRTMDDLVSPYNIFSNHIGYDFMVRKIIPDIKRELAGCGYLKESNFAEGMDSSFLFAFQDQLYVLGADFSVLEIEDYCAIGSGANQAIGSLLSSEGLPPEERIIKSIKASAANDLYVDYPIILTNTAETEFKIITENDSSVQ